MNSVNKLRWTELVLNSTTERKHILPQYGNTNTNTCRSTNHIWYKLKNIKSIELNAVGFVFIGNVAIYVSNVIQVSTYAVCVCVVCVCMWCIKPILIHIPYSPVNDTISVRAYSSFPPLLASAAFTFLALLIFDLMAYFFFAFLA